MRFNPSATREQVLGALRRSAEQNYGKERLGELEPWLEIAAGHLWRLGQQAFDTMEHEPDRLAMGGPRG